MKQIAILGVLLGLSACGPTPEEIVAYKEKLDDRRIARCDELGFKKDTDAFANCRLKLETERAQQRVIVPAYPYLANPYYHHPYFVRHPYSRRYW